MSRDGAIPITGHDYCVHAIGDDSRVENGGLELGYLREFKSKLLNIYLELGSDSFLFVLAEVIFCVMPRPRI